MTVSVRPLAPGDRQDWETLWQGYLAFYENPLPPATIDDLWRRLMTPHQGHDGLAAVEGDGRIIGIVHYLLHDSTWDVAPVCYLEDLYVDDTVRGEGVGRALIEAVSTAAGNRGASLVHWLTDTDNTEARRLYDWIGTLSPYVQYTKDQK